MRFATVITFLILVAAAGCSCLPSITVRNQSTLTLSNVVLSGSGFSERIGTIPAGQDHQLVVRPRGESGVRLVFDAGTQHVDSGPQGYFESGGGYRVAATISTNLSVDVSVDLRPY